MPTDNHQAAYGRKTIVLHWGMALLFIVAFILGQVMEELPRGPEKLSVLGWHLLVGGAVFLLALPRLMRRRKLRVFRDQGAPWERGTAKAVHFVLYALMIVLPLSGFLAGASLPATIPLPGGFELSPLFSSPWLHEAMEETHEFLVVALVWGVGLHIAGTLWHKFIKRDGVAGRMSPFARKHSAS